jgi:proline-specific peptidase
MTKKMWGGILIVLAVVLGIGIFIVDANREKKTSIVQENTGEPIFLGERGGEIEGDIVMSDGVRLHYWFYNRDTQHTTIFLHGGPGHGSEDFRFLQAKEYADTFGSLLVFDQRGCGASQHTPSMAASMTYDRAVKDINELREYLIPHQNVVVFGRSFGGLLATHYAASYPVGVLGYILAAPGEFHHEISLEGSKELNDKGLAETSLIGQSSIAKAVKQERDILSERYAEMRKQTSAEVMEISEQDEQEIHDLTKAYQENEGMLERNDYPLLVSMAQLPLLVVSGEYDTVVPPLAVEAMKPYVPNATFIQLTQGWHSAAYVQQEVFFQAVKIFFSTLAQ